MEKATIGLTMWMSLELPVLRGNLFLGYAHSWQPNRLLRAREVHVVDAKLLGGVAT